ncbi:hypothetical protein FRB90_004263 [Tulasnella sp. 427]|nr:hypothetical protein FRB90_004263 [Tulasnella sp. 427]
MVPEFIKGFSISAAIDKSHTGDEFGSLEVASDVEEEVPPPSPKPLSNSPQGRAGRHCHPQPNQPPPITLPKVDLDRVERGPAPRQGAPGDGEPEDGELGENDWDSGAGLEDGELRDMVTQTNKRKRSGNAQKMRNRRKKKRANPQPHPTQLRHLKQAEAAHSTNFASAEAPHTQPGFVGPTRRVGTLASDAGIPDLNIPLPPGDGITHPLVEHLQVNHGFSLRSAPPTERTAAFESADKKKIFLIRTRPSNSSWKAVALERVKALFSALNLPDSASHHRRGDFFAACYGFSHGNGRKASNCFMTDERARAWQAFLADSVIHGMMLYISTIFSIWSPKLCEMYRSCHAALRSWNPDLRCPSPSLPFSTITVNFGPKTVCRWHRDVFNLVFGWCVIWALGNYDSRYGGHLILWEPRLIIEFAPGDIIFLPSACITHANIPIREGEHRYSVTWYTSGQLFRYQALHLAPSSNEKPTEGSEATDPAEEGKRSRWMEGLDCFMSLDELRQHHTGDGAL